MGVFWAACLIVAASALAVGAMLLVRRRSPDGGHFKDGDRAAGVFGVLATGFSVMLGLIVVLAFTSYDESRAGAETEARLVTQQFQTAQFLPASVAGPLGDQLICYARSVAYEEWPRLESGAGASVANRWAIPLFRTTKATRPVTPAEQAAYSLWLDQTSERQGARQDRLYSADGVITAPLWIVLLFTAVVIFGFMLFFADRGEHAVVQATLVGSVVAVIVATLLLIRALDDPYRPGVGSLEPRAMERALVALEFQRRVVGRTAPLPCTDTGAPRT